MQLSLSIAASDRAFSRRMRKVSARFLDLEAAFASIELRDPIHEALLVGITNDKAPSYFAEIPNRDGVFQILAGCDAGLAEDDLQRHVFEVLRKAMRACPFSKPDHDALEALFAQFEPTPR